MAKIVHEIKVNSDADKVWDVMAGLGELDMWSPSLRYRVSELAAYDDLTSVVDIKSSVVEWESGKRVGYFVTGVEGVTSLYNVLSVRPDGSDTTVTSTLGFEVDGEDTDALGVERDFAYYMSESLACLKHFAEIESPAL